MRALGRRQRAVLIALRDQPGQTDHAIAGAVARQLYFESLNVVELSGVAWFHRVCQSLMRRGLVERRLTSRGWRYFAVAAVEAE